MRLWKAKKELWFLKKFQVANDDALNCFLEEKVFFKKILKVGQTQALYSLEASMLKQIITILICYWKSLLINNKGFMIQKKNGR